MRTHTINGLLQDAAMAMQQGRAALAHRLICTADRIAQGDRTVSTARRDAIRTARLAVAIAI